jgi:hypothetical protein
VGGQLLAQVLRRDQAITALTVTELLQSGRDRNDPLVRGLREELG